MKIVPIDRRMLIDWFVRELNVASPAVGILLGGDRLSCVNEGVGLVDGDLILGVATIAHEGEWHNGEPTIVAVYVREQFRGKGWGLKLFLAAVDRCRELGLVPVRYDAVFPSESVELTKVPADYREYIRIFDSTAALADMSPQLASHSEFATW